MDTLKRVDEAYTHLVVVPLLIMALSSVGLILVSGKQVLVPFVIAILLSYLLRPVVDIITTPFTRWFLWCRKSRQQTVEVSENQSLLSYGSSSRSPELGSRSPARERDPDCQLLSFRQLPRWVAVMGSLFVALGGITIAILIVADSIQEFERHNLQDYENQAAKLATAVVDWTKEHFKVDGTQIVDQLRREFPLGSIFKESIYFVVDSLVTMLVILLFVIYLLMEPKRASPETSLREKIDNQVQRYLVLKTTISACVAVFVYVIYMFLQIKLANLFAMITFFLNFIPNVGPIVASLLPLPVIVLDPSLSGVTMTLALLLPILVHGLVGNVVEPLIFGERMELHPVVVLLALAFWYATWGTAGAILAVPVTAVLRIVLLHINHPYGRAILFLLEGRPYLLIDQSELTDEEDALLTVDEEIGKLE